MLQYQLLQKNQTLSFSNEVFKQLAETFYFVPTYFPQQGQYHDCRFTERCKNELMFLEHSNTVMSAIGQSTRKLIILSSVQNLNSAQ